MSQGNTYGVLKERTGYYFKVRRVVMSDGTDLEISIRKGKGEGIGSIAVRSHFVFLISTIICLFQKLVELVIYLSFAVKRFSLVTLSS